MLNNHKLNENRHIYLFIQPILGSECIKFPISHQPRKSWNLSYPLSPPFLYSTWSVFSTSNACCAWCGTAPVICCETRHPGIDRALGHGEGLSSTPRKTLSLPGGYTEDRMSNWICNLTEHFFNINLMISNVSSKRQDETNASTRKVVSSQGVGARNT